MTEWLWQDGEARSAAEQMAVDCAMVAVGRDLDVAIMRLYRWRDNTVSFGTHEAALRRWDRRRLAGDGVATVRRPTGGRAVWHDRDDLTYAWTGPIRGPAEVAVRYRELHQRLGIALAAPSRRVEFAAMGARPDLGPGACFDLAAGGEVLIDGRKAIGSAQRVLGDRLLQHGAIAVADRHDALARFALDPLPTARAVARATIGTAAEAADAIARRWLDDGAREIASALTSRIVLASVEEVPRFGDPDWTWRR